MQGKEPDKIWLHALGMNCMSNAKAKHPFNINFAKEHTRCMASFAAVSCVSVARQLTAHTFHNLQLRLGSKEFLADPSVAGYALGVL